MAVDEVGLELDVRDARHQPEDEAVDDRRDRIGDLQHVRER
jgi:hypothetical protein